MSDSVHDYVIVGAGSAGCVLASRLSEDPKRSVALLEAGGDDRPWRNLGQALTNIKISIPGAVAEALRDPRVSWGDSTEPDPSTEGRRHPWPRGRVLGGSSSLNGMIYVRGQHADFDHWRQLGCVGWSWTDVLPYFRRAERFEGGANAWRGHRGPLNVTRVKASLDVGEAAIRAFAEAGIPISEDVNGSRQEGVERIQLTVRDGRRCSASVSYLHPAMRRPNLRVETNAQALRIIFEGRRAIGVEYERGGIRHVIQAAREVLISAGVVNSPQLLELSGIGDGGRLSALGLPVVVDSPNVGENLQDHFNVPMVFRLKPGVASLNTLARPAAQFAALAQYGLGRRGILSESPCFATAFIKTRAELEDPDVKFVVMALSMGWRTGADGRPLFAIHEEPGLTLAPAQLRPESRGSIHLKSSDPKVRPAIIANYLQHPVDQRVVVEALRFGRLVAAQPALRPFVAKALAPGPEVQTDEALLAFARETGGTGYHGVGTCRMGGGRDSVLDPELRVRGVEGLRVVDASIMPRIVSGNTNAAAIMIGERAADLILGRAAPSADAALGIASLAAV